MNTKDEAKQVQKNARNLTSIGDFKQAYDSVDRHVVTRKFPMDAKDRVFYKHMRTI